MKLDKAQHNTLALDIGGANIKACYCDQTGQAHAFSRHFLLSRDVDALAEHLKRLVSECSVEPAHWLVTMTGELCDCFTDRQQGVNVILDAVENVSADATVLVWSTDGEYVDVAQARQQPLRVASANWHVQATALGKMHPDKRMILVDTGSTTTDIIPILHGQVATVGLTDSQRLTAGELVYLGGSLTPLMALSDTGQGLRLMNEFFANMQDLAVVFGNMPEAPDNWDSPDGCAYDYDSCMRRLYRMLGRDVDLNCPRQVQQSEVKPMLDAALDRLAEPFTLLLRKYEPVETVLLSGSGCWLPASMIKREGVDREVILMDTLWPQGYSTSACALALLLVA